MDRIGILVALAYPDRVARRRGGQRGRYQLSNGRGAVLAEDDALAREEFLAIADLDAGEHEGRVYLAAPLSRAQMEEAFTGQLATVDHIAWDSRSQTITARTEQRLGKLVIGESALEQPAPERLVRATLDGIREVGIAALPWDEETRRWQARVSFLRGLDPLGWPDVSDQSLLDSITGWLAPFLPGVTRRDQFSRIDLRAALHALLTWPQQRELYEQAPTHLPVPSGSRIALDYSAEDGPVLAARLQELFGLSETPRIARGRVPITIHLLSPARRPVQVTRDLASFWAHGYHEVKKELKGRYPRHYWPDDPSGATATRRVRPR